MTHACPLPSRRRLWTAALILALTAAACSPPPPVASNAVPTPATPSGDKPIIWAALGGDETLTGQPQAAQNAWTQRVLSHLPATAQLFNLATEDASVQTGLSTQLSALQGQAIAPSVATVWFGTAEPNTNKTQFTQDLTTLVTRLKDLGVQHVVLIARPTSEGRGGYRYAPEIQNVASNSGATYVAITALTGNPTDPGAQSAIADQLAPQINH